MLGFLQSVVPFSNLLHLLVSNFLEKGKSPKKIACLASIISRPFLILIAASFFLKDSTTGKILFISSYTFFYLLVAVTGGAFWPWCKKLVPKAVTISFFAQRMRYILLIKIITVTTVTTWLAFLPKHQQSLDFLLYSLFLTIAFVFGILYTLTLFQMEDVRLEYQSIIPFHQKIRIIIKQKSFLKFLFNIGLYNFTLSFFIPFCIVFLLKALGLSTPISIMFSVGSSCIDILFINFWRKYAQKKSVAQMIFRASFFFVFSSILLIYLSIYQIGTYPILIIAFISIGIANSGANLAISDASIAFVPSKMSSVYISLMNIGRFGFSGLGSFMAGITLEILEGIIPNKWTAFFIISAILFSIAATRIKQIKPIEE